MCDGSLTCFDEEANLGGAPPGAPRATWWVRLAYARLSVGEYFHASSSPTAAVLGAYDGAGCAGVLVGAAVAGLKVGEKLSLKRVPSTLLHDGGRLLSVKYYHITAGDHRGCGDVPQPEPQASVATITATGSAAIELPAMGKGDALYLALGGECAPPW